MSRNVWNWVSSPPVHQPVKVRVLTSNTAGSQIHGSLQWVFRASCATSRARMPTPLAMPSVSLSTTGSSPASIPRAMSNTQEKFV